MLLLSGSGTVQRVAVVMGADVAVRVSGGRMPDNPRARPVW